MVLFDFLYGLCIKTESGQGQNGMMQIKLSRFIMILATPPPQKAHGTGLYVTLTHGPESLRKEHLQEKLWPFNHEKRVEI